MSQMLNKSNQLPRETTQITTSFVPAVSASSNSNMNGPHNNSSGHIIPVMIPQRNLHQVNQSLVQSPQTLILSDTISTQSTYPSTETNQMNFQKTPHLSVKVLTNPATNHHTNLVNGIGQGICLAAAPTTQPSISSQIMTAKGSMTSQSSTHQAPHILPKQRVVSKMKLNASQAAPIQSSQSNQQNSNSPIPIYPSTMNQSNLKDLSSRLVIHQKTTTNPSTQAISLNQNVDLDANNSSSSGSNITSIPVVNANSRQVNLMMVTNNLSTSAAASSTSSTSGCTNSLIIGNSTFSSNQLIKNQPISISSSGSSSIVANNQSTTTQPQSAIKPLVNISHQSSNAPNAVGVTQQSISLNNVLLTSQGQSVNNANSNQQNSGLLIKQQNQPQSENQLLSTDTRHQIPVSIVVGSIGTTGRMTANSLSTPIKMETNNGSIVTTNSVSSALIRGMSVNQHTLANSFIGTAQSQLHQPTPTQQQQQQQQHKVQQHNNTQSVITKQQFTSYSNSAAAVAAAISKKRSRKQVLQTGSISSKAHHQGQTMNNANNKIMINSTTTDQHQQKHQPGPTTALLITTSNNNNNNSVVNHSDTVPSMNKLVTIGSTSTTTCPTSSSTHQIQMHTNSTNNPVSMQQHQQQSQSSNIFGFRLVPMKSNMTPSSTATTTPATGSQQSTTTTIGSTQQSMGASIRLTNAQSSLPLPPPSQPSQANMNHQIYISPATTQQQQQTSSFSQSNSMDIIRSTTITPSSLSGTDHGDLSSKNSLPDEHEIAESLIKTCNELENHKKTHKLAAVADGPVHNQTSQQQQQSQSIISVPPSNAKATHFLTHAEVKLKSLSSLNNGFLSYLASELLDEQDYESTRGKKMISSNNNNKRAYSASANKSSSEPSSNINSIASTNEFKKESYILWNTLFDLRIKQSSTQFVRYPIATGSPFDVTGWRLLQSTNNLEFLKNLEFYACSSLHNMESILTDYISSNKDSLISPVNSLTNDVSSTSKDAKRPRISNGEIEDGIEAMEEQEEEDVKPKRTFTKNKDFILKLEKTLEFLKGLEQRQKILWERMSGIIDMTNGLMQNHRYPALQIFDDLSLFISHVNQRNQNNNNNNSTSPTTTTTQDDQSMIINEATNNNNNRLNSNYNNGIDPGSDSDEATQSEESMIKT